MNDWSLYVDWGNLQVGEESNALIRTLLKKSKNDDSSLNLKSLNYSICQNKIINIYQFNVKFKVDTNLMKAFHLRTNWLVMI